MEIEAPPRQQRRSWTRCWTCRQSHRKCGKQRPVCNLCDELELPCDYGRERPSWMDDGARQEKRNAYLKRKVRGEGLNANPDTYRRVTSHALDVGSQRYTRCKFALVEPSQSDDSDLITFYTEHVVPFLFPFYQPPLLQGKKTWIADMMTHSPVVRQAALCQSSYFYSLSRGAVHDGGSFWEAILTQTVEAFGVLRQALKAISDSDITQHLHGAVRVLSAIIQMQRFDIAVSSFENCQLHLNAALALFKQLLDSVGNPKQLGFNSSFEAIMYNLGPPSWNSSLYGQLPSPEQAAFRFSSTLLVFDDIIASTVLQEKPRLYEFHHTLLEGTQGTGPVIDLEAVIGCQNWVLVQIAEIAVLDAWKHQCKNSGTLDVVELMYHSMAIKNSLETNLAPIQAHTVASSKEDGSVFDVSATNNSIRSQKSLITLVWAHGALIYLAVVLGWQPTNAEISYHVRHIIEVLVRQVSPPALLGTIVWPLCVAGCLAEPDLATQLRGILEALEPRSVSGTLTKALEVMTHVWRNGNLEDIAYRDLASCFRSQGDLVLLV
ncbi:fungal-specific transcription factor domain-containing protein [Nemania sp. FL0031]|nr:fungal-specific transcription factor domain-containing protein [Nemania sp. FL0031]